MPLPAKPTVNGDKDTWGGVVNTYFDKLTAKTPGNFIKNVNGDLVEVAVEDEVAATTAVQTNTAAVARVDPGSTGADYEHLGWIGGLPAKLGPISLSITWFGAKANDPAFDNIPKINLTIAAVSALGGGEVVIPSNATFYVAPTASSWIQCQSGVSLRGMGWGSRLKIKDNNGDWNYLFSGTAGPSTHIDNLTITNLTVDSNATGNTTCNVRTGGTGGQDTFRFDNFTALVFDRVNLDPYTGVNPFKLIGENAAVGSDSLWITNCRCVFARGAATTRYDSSTVYAVCRHATITNNQFYFFGADADAPAGCIEIHGPHQIVKNNLIYRFMIGGWVAGHTLTSLTEVIAASEVSGNSYLHCGAGIGVNGTPATTTPQKGVLVTNNLIHIDSAHFPMITQPFAVSVAGFDGTTAPRDVTVAHNVIVYEDDTRTVNGDGVAMDFETNGAAIVLRSCTTDSLRRVTVHHNEIYNAPGTAIRFNGPTNSVLEDIWVHHNLIVDAGANENIGSTLRTGIKSGAALNFRRVVVEDNRIHDTGATALNGVYAWLLNTITGTDTDLTLQRNRYKSQSGTLSVSVGTNIKVQSVVLALDFPSIAAQTCAELSVTVPGAVFAQDGAYASPVSSVGGDANTSWSAYVSANDTIKVRLCNNSAAAIDPASRQWVVGIQQR